MTNRRRPTKAETVHLVRVAFFLIVTVVLAWTTEGQAAPVKDQEGIEHPGASWRVELESAAEISPRPSFGAFLPEAEMHACFRAESSSVPNGDRGRMLSVLRPPGRDRVPTVLACREARVDMALSCEAGRLVLRL